MAISKDRVRQASSDVTDVIGWLFWANAEDFVNAFGDTLGVHLWSKWVEHMNASRFIGHLDTVNLRKMTRAALEKSEGDTNV